MQGSRLFTFSKRQRDRFRPAIFLPLFAFISLPFFCLTITPQEKKGDKEAPGTISGCVKINGKPASGIQLSLRDYDYVAGQKSVASTTTDEGGCYRLTNIPPNHYWLEPLAPESINADEKNDYRSGRRVSVAPGAIVHNFDIELVTAGVISGRITDAEGKPVANEQLSLTRVSFYEAKAYFYSPSDTVQSKSDADGYYRITGIQPGRYLVSAGEDIERLSGAVHYKNDTFGAQGRIGKNFYYEQTYCPGVKDKIEARIIEVSTGRIIEGADIIVGELKKSFTARGRAIEAETGKPIPSYSLQVIHKYGGGYQGIIADDKTDDEGYFHIEGLIPGTFSVRVCFRGDTPLYTKALDFEIKDEDIDGLKLVARKGLSISGSIQIENGNQSARSKLSDLELHVHDIRDGNSSEFIYRDTHIRSDGSFTIPGLFTGLAELGMLSSDFELKSVEYTTSQGKMQRSPEGPFGKVLIPLKDADLNNLRVIVAYKGGSIKGQVKTIGGKLSPEIELEAMISKKTGTGFWTTSRVVDVQGTFSIDGLEEGEYDIHIRDRFNARHLASEHKIIKVSKNAEVTASFEIDLSKKKARD
jgi:hypothetical protein